MISDRATTEKLVLRAQQGDKEALGQLFTNHKQMVYSVAYTVVSDAQIAEDLCQDVFLIAQKKLWQLDDPKRFSGWLRTTTRRTAINFAIREREPSCTLDCADKFCLADWISPDRLLGTKERAQFIHLGLDSLSLLDKNTLQQFYFEGLSIKEMCDRWDAPVGTIKRRLHVARKRLAKQLARVNL